MKDLSTRDPDRIRLRILVVHNRYRSDQPSGENMVVDQETALLRAAGHDVAHYERSSDDIAKFSVIQKVELPLRVAWSVRDSRALGQMLAEFQPDVVHVHNTFPLISASILRTCTAAGVPVVATLHNFRLYCAAGTFLRNDLPCQSCVKHGPLPAVVHGCYRGSPVASVPIAVSIGVHRAARTWHKGVARFLVMSQFAKALMVNAGLPVENLIVKPNFVPAPESIRHGRGDFMMYVGRLSRDKGVDLLVDAWRPDFGELLIVGDGDERSALEDQVRAGGHQNIRLLGLKPRSEAMQLVARSTAVVMPSRWYETFGMSAVEALAHGVPAIVPDQGVLPEIINDNESGIHFRSGDAVSLSGAIRSMLAGDTTIRLGHAARQRYLDLYSPERNLSMLLDIYRSAMASN